MLSVIILTICETLHHNKINTRVNIYPCFSHALSPYGDETTPAKRNARIWMDNVKCAGGENTLEDCDFTGIGVSNCDHTEDATVNCTSQARGSNRAASGKSISKLLLVI